MTERPIAAIDIGTNSFHMVVARVGEVSGAGEFIGPAFVTIAREKEIVRLGSSSGDMKELSEDAINRGVLALKRLVKIAAVHDADVVAVATSAVREAENADVFIKRAREEAGVVVDVIAGIEEARLIHIGVLQAVPVFDQRLVLIDIGGGSTEILVGEQGETLAAGSLKLGAIRLTRRFFQSENLHPGSVESCRRHVRSVLAPMVREAKRVGFGVAIASSGTAETVAALVNAQRGNSTPRTFNNFTMTRSEIVSAVELLISATSVDERKVLSGMDPSRADIILAGAIILEQAVEKLNIDEIVISDNALREGVLLDALSRRRGATLHHLRDLRRRSILHLAESMDDDVAHSMRAAGFALDLFDATSSLHGLGDDSRELLEAGALLANVGSSVSHSEHHKHSYYVIRHSDRLAGFTDHEIELIAQISRYHRKSAPKPKHEEFARLRPEDQDRIRILAGLLRVGIALDRSHSGRVESLKIDTDSRSDSVIISVHRREDSDIELEVQTAEDRKGLLESVLERHIQFDVL
ncbi:MAG: Ppx/GppA phosphatase family protein [Acidimicrobiales bacterium]